MDSFEQILYSLDLALNTPRKRHIVGGILLSLSLLFGGLAGTVMTIGKADEEVFEDDE